MSIVESVLNKAKEATRVAARDLRAAERRIAPAVVGATSVGELALPGESAARAQKPVAIDLDAIRREGMLPPEDQANSVAEEFRRIKWPLIASALGKGGVARLERGNLLLVTSAVPGEGKSFVSLNLALSVALERDSRVLLVDADPAKARISRLCRVVEHPGLTELFSDDSLTADDLIIATNVPGLEVLPAGRSDPRTAELFASRRAERCLHELAERNPDRVIVVDSPPLLATSEAQVLSRIAGQVLMVVRADVTPRRAAQDAVTLLEPGRTVRCVLNQTPVGLFGESYYYAHERG